MNTQLRGHCQYCGNLQARLKTGTMSKHGYTVDHGWFNGVCQGEHHRSIEEDRSVTDKVIAQVKADVAKMQEDVDALKAGHKVPETAKMYRGIPGKEVEVPFHEASEYEQLREVEMMVWNLQGRIRAGNDYVTFMQKIAGEFHGKPLVEVEKKKGPAPLQIGEQRVYPTREGDLICRLDSYDGRRAYFSYVYTNTEGKRMRRKSWIGTRAWRQMEKA